MKPSLYTFPSFPPLIQIYSALSTKEPRSTDNFLKEIFPELSTSCKILLHRYCGNFLYHPPFPLADPDLSFFLEPSNHFPEISLISLRYHHPSEVPFVICPYFLILICI